MWLKRAHQLCDGAYREIEVEGYADSKFPGYIVSVHRGYALCDAAPLSIEQARTVLDGSARITAATPRPASTP